MSMEFGWWLRDAAGRRFQVRVRIAGGNVAWSRKQGHHQPWEAYGPPTEEDWSHLFAEAERRVPRRLISPAQFAAIKRLRPARNAARNHPPAEPGAEEKPERATPSP